MLTTSNTKFIRKYIAIALGLLLTSVYSVQANAQTNPSQSTGNSSTTPAGNSTPNDYNSGYLEGIEAGHSNWGFSSASESKSLDNNLNKLGQYNISESDSDKKDVIINRSWGNQGDVKNRSVETPVYKF
ncbi:hypothetical protein [Pleurocapsa sp. FMAR1]|uniref:hypothetical protein n=1 Tax=Pleurocapsa sp. FMAR1 TaxID=3040204 RepID=UPI0029C8E02B|nr:hypothetical protein [Pleurocapsa sp. FMAR1]